jgi:cysteine-rich repeat protein
LVPNEYSFYQKWEFYNTGYNFADIGQWSFNSTEDADIDAMEAWDITTGNGIIIGNPDQSVMWYHKDLVNNIIKNLGEDFDGDGEVIIYNGTTSEGSPYNHTYPSYYFDPDDVNGIDDDGNGKIDDFIGWDFMGRDNDPSDTRNHGTQTSGVIAAEANNSYSVMGVCWNCTIIPSATTSYQDEGILYGVNLGARAVTLSWYLSGPSQGMIEAVEYATQNNASVILGAGNWENPYVNPSCKIKEVICVTGTDWYDRLWTYPPWNEGTDYGPKSDVGAPASLHTTTGAFASTAYPHQFSQGTSLAAPTVAGVIGLMLSINPDLNPYEVKSIVQTAVDPFVQQDRYAGNGRINAHTAVLLANQSLQYGSFPVTIIDANSTSYSDTSIEIMGISRSQDFYKSEIYVGQGVYPDTFELITQLNNSVEEGLMYSLNLNEVSNLVADDWQLKIITYDIYNQTSQDTYPFVVTDIGICGNGIIEPPLEECDDNNTVSGDGCSDVCISEYCGDGIINNQREECENGDFGGADCLTNGFTNGTLSCTKSCEYDNSSCYNVTNISLTQGWNFVSLPHNLTNKSIGRFESNIVLSYSAGEWGTYYAGILEEITEIEIAKGYIIYSDEAKTLLFDEGPISQYNYSLIPNSWNLVGSTSAGYNFSNNYIYNSMGDSISSAGIVLGNAYWVYTGSDPQHSPFNLSKIGYQN